MLLAFAIALEMFSMGIATSLEMQNEGLSKATIIKHIILLSSLFIVSATLGGTLLQHLPDYWMELVLSFGLSALLYLVTEELWQKCIPKKTNRCTPELFYWACSFS